MPTNPRFPIAVIGCGHWGRNLVRVLGHLDALAVVCDRSPAARAEARRIVPRVEVVESLDEALSESVRGVVIAAPSESHYRLAMSALEAGKDVFVEKPLSLTYRDGARLVTQAEKRKCILMVGHVLEYHPAIVKLSDLVRRGDLGEIHYVYSNRLSLGKVRREENILWSFAPHDIAVILRLMGNSPFQIVACGGSYLQPKTADVTVTQFLFENGVRAHIHVSWLHPFKEQRLVVIGSERMASFDDVAKKLILYDQPANIRNGEPSPLKSEGREIPFAADEPLLLECQAFLAAIESRRPPLTDGWSGLRVLKVLEAAQRSLMSQGEPVDLPIEALHG